MPAGSATFYRSADEKTITLLDQAAAEERLPAEEHARRIEAALHAETDYHLSHLISDLPAGRGDISASRNYLAEYWKYAIAGFASLLVMVPGSISFYALTGHQAVVGTGENAYLMDQHSALAISMVVTLVLIGVIGLCATGLAASAHSAHEKERSKYR